MREFAQAPSDNGRYNRRAYGQQDGVDAQLSAAVGPWRVLPRSNRSAHRRRSFTPTTTSAAGGSQRRDVRPPTSSP
jgi:hypothetical protein